MGGAERGRHGRTRGRADFSAQLDGGLTPADRVRWSRARRCQACGRAAALGVPARPPVATTPCGYAGDTPASGSAETAGDERAVGAVESGVVFGRLERGGN